MYAIIKTGGKQYKVAPGDVIQVEKLQGAAGQAVEFPALAVSADNAEPQAGKSVTARVSGVIVGETRGKKLLVFKFKRKKQYKKTIGHRQSYTTIQVGDIQV